MVSDLWIRCYHPTERNAYRLVCFPHAGGSASYFFPFSKLLTPEIEVLSIQYPGRQDRRAERCIESISELADEVQMALRDWVRRPYAFFGHSMGAILAFEVAQRLAEANEGGPRWLFASGRRAPSRYRDENVHLTDDELLALELSAIGATDRTFLDDPELRSVILPVTRSDYKAIETYRCKPGSRLKCPITVLVGDRDLKTSAEEAAAWREHSLGRFDLHTFPGGHFYLDENRTSVAELITSSLTG
jgi:pyochelin biosynthesis protein PchC